MKNSKSIIKFILIFIASFILIEAIEESVKMYFGVELSGMKWGWFGLVIIYGIKYHIFCCLLPAVWIGYKCRHKKCKHEYCEHD